MLSVLADVGGLLAGVMQVRETSLKFRVYQEFLLYKFKQLPPPQRWPGVVIRSTHWSGQKGWGSWEQERLNFFFPKYFLSSSCHIVTGVSSFHPTECPHIRCSSSHKNWAPWCWSGQSLPSSYSSVLEPCSLLSGRWGKPGISFNICRVIKVLITFKMFVGKLHLFPPLSCPTFAHRFFKC